MEAAASCSLPPSRSLCLRPTLSCSRKVSEALCGWMKSGKWTKFPSWAPARLITRYSERRSRPIGSNYSVHRASTTCSWIRQNSVGGARQLPEYLGSLGRMKRLVENRGGLQFSQSFLCILAEASTHEATPNLRI